MTTANSTDQTNPEQCRHLGVDKGSKEGDRTVMMGEKYEAAIFDRYTAFVLSKAFAKNTEMRIRQGIIGAATETGELLDALKKHMFQGRPIDVTNIKEECGDLWFYFTEIMVAVDTDIFEVMEMNIAKLSKRYSKEFTTKESINRDIDKEREILEGADQDCASCADTDCSSKPYPQRVCREYVNNRNYPVAPISQREAEQRKACCGNCAKRLTLEGCSRYVKTNNDGCCIDHKFL